MITHRVCLEKFDEVLSVLTDAFQQLENALPPPVLVSTTGQGWVPRYRPPLLEHALLMKLARLISVTSAMQRLVESGHVHEQGILQRVADETGDDIFFLALGKQNGLRAIHRQYLKHFWREEFDGPAKPETYTPRHMVRRSDISVYVAKHMPELKGVNQVIYGVFSGFVHGASTPIFDLVDSAGRYRLRGVQDEKDRLGYLHSALNYPLRTLMAAVLVARSLGERDIADNLLAHSDEFHAWFEAQES